MDVATNPRIAKAGFNVGGGTLVDIFTNSPAFAPSVNALLAQVGIQRGTPKFLQFLVVAEASLHRSRNGRGSRRRGRPPGGG